MATTMSTEDSDSIPRGRRVELKDEYVDASWKQRWMNAKAKYPEELIDNVGKVRGLFASAEAPSLEDQVFLVCRTDRHAAGQVDVVQAYSSVPAANEHVLLLFAKEYGDSLDTQCSWSIKGGSSAKALSSGSTDAMWAFSPHACLSLEINLPEDDEQGPHKVFIVERWIETEPPEQLVKRVLG